MSKGSAKGMQCDGISEVFPFLCIQLRFPSKLEANTASYSPNGINKSTEFQNSELLWPVSLQPEVKPSETYKLHPDSFMNLIYCIPLMFKAEMVMNWKINQSNEMLTKIV